MKTLIQRTAFAAAALLPLTATSVMAQNQDLPDTVNYERLATDLCCGGLLFTLLIAGLWLFKWARRIRRQTEVHQLVHGDWLNEWDRSNYNRKSHLGFYKKAEKRKNNRGITGD